MHARPPSQGDVKDGLRPRCPPQVLLFHPSKEEGLPKALSMDSFSEGARLWERILGRRSDFGKSHRKH